MDYHKTKNVLLKNIYIILIILIGWAIIWIGAIGKITSAPWSNQFITYGILFQIVGCILGIVKVFIHKGKDEASTKNQKRITKYIILLILIGIIISSFGALGKVTSMSWSDSCLKIGFLFQCIGYLLGVIKLLSLKQVRDFLKS